MVSRNRNTIFQRVRTLIFHDLRVWILQKSEYIFFLVDRPSNISLLTFLIEKKKSCSITVSNRKIIIERDFRPGNHNAEI